MHHFIWDALLATTTRFYQNATLIILSTPISVASLYIIIGENTGECFYCSGPMIQ